MKNNCQNNKRDYCSYSVTPATMNTGTNTVDVTVSYSLPFKVSTSFENAVWYYATIRGTKYLRADEDNKDASGRYTSSATNEESAAYRWAFFGNPYSYFYIANEGAGEGKYLYAAEQPTMQAVENPAETEAALWVVSPNGDGFTLRSITGANLYINDNSNVGNLGYWDNAAGATDAGSRWNIEEVPNSPVGIGSFGLPDNSANAMYDLSGRRVARPQKGVFIINRRKVVE